jgi:hypothetical protein
MIPDTTVDRYYYIFDSRERRAVVMDRTTGDEFAWADDPRAQLVRHVDARQASAARAFAGWCARLVGAPEAAAHTPTGRLWAALQRRREDRPAGGEPAGGEPAGGEPADGGRAAGAAGFETVREATSDAAVIACAVGLSRREARAARLLTVQAVTHRDPIRAAIDAAHMSERWAEFRAGEQGAAPTAGPPADAVDEPARKPEEAARAMRRRHVNRLLDALGYEGQPRGAR